MEGQNCAVDECHRKTFFVYAVYPNQTEHHIEDRQLDHQDTQVDQDVVVLMDLLDGPLHHCQHNYNLEGSDQCEDVDYDLHVSDQLEECMALQKTKAHHTTIVLSIRFM